MKILIADKLSPKAITELEKLGGDVIFSPSLKADELVNHLEGIEILIVRSTVVSAEAIEAAKALSLIIRAGAGVNNIDLTTASGRGINVANCPGKNKDAVAELVIGFLIAADRQILAGSNDLRDGKWRKKFYGGAPGLKTRTLGIIGTGSIGMAVADIAKAMGMNVVAWSRSLDVQKAESLGLGWCSTPEAVAEQSDAVSIHLAKKPGTIGMINKNFLDHMKEGAILINTSRGEIHNTADLKAAIKEKGLKVCLDVFENEPAGGDTDFNDPELAAMITCTPHIGASTAQAADAIADEAVRIVKEYLLTGSPANVLNLRAHAQTGSNLLVRHYNKVGVLAGILSHLKGEGINVEEMSNTIFDGNAAAVCTLKLDRAPSNDTLASLEGTENVIQAVVK